MKYEVTSDENILYKRMNHLRGVMALVVLFSHIWGYTGMVVLVPFNKMVTIAVAVFFFLSGYGLMRSYDHNKNYLSSILRKKIPFLIYMSLIAYFVSAFLEYILKRIWNVNAGYYLRFNIENFFISTNWYVYELLAFYFLFLFIMKFVSSKWQITVMFLISSLAFIALYYSGVVEAYYNSIFGFVFGMFCWKYSFLMWTEKLNAKILWGGGNGYFGICLWMHVYDRYNIYMVCTCS